MKDRITAGFLSGVAAGIAMNIIDWLGIIAGLYQERLLDWAAIMIYGRLPLTIVATVFAQLGQLFFAGFLGIIFAALLLKFTSGNYLLKGWLFGIIAWFSIYAISSAIRLPALATHSVAAVIAHFLSASLYGLVLARTLNRLERV